MPDQNHLLYDLSFPDLVAIINEQGEPVYRAQQIWEGLYRQLYKTLDEFTALPKRLRVKLSSTFRFEALVPVTSLTSRDGNTVKTLLSLNDGQAIEAVLMKYNNRQTLCISTQVGCAMGCIFCATGQMGFKRHLSSGEILAQVIFYARELNAQGKLVTNVVVMGMGEPFHNYDAVMTAITLLNDPRGYNFGSRRFTISTVGLVPAIRRFTTEGHQMNLAISLHAVDDALRCSMLPANKIYPVDELLDACRDYVSTSGRRITFEWALINGINDTEEQAHLLAEKLQGMICHVNAIPLNPTPVYPGQATTRQRAYKFREILLKFGIPCTIRLRRGLDIKAGCGQLANNIL